MKESIESSVAESSGAANEGSLEAGMQEMMIAAFAGHSINLTVAGNEIIETNGTLSEDGTSASLTIPLVDLFRGNANQLPAEFTANVRLQSCFLWDRLQLTVLSVKDPLAVSRLEIWQAASSY